ncbi:MAG TPA: hypothetical protein VKS25_14540 [Solirubrobacteraceae bacterium]|nr:hypothetical protein [Solirubrobacteraceae bacterium]
MPRRWLAALIDLSAFLGGAVAVLVGLVRLPKLAPVARLARRRRLRRFRIEALNTSLSTLRGRLALEATALAIGVMTRNSRGPGSRLLGLRRVEVSSGACVGVRAALVRSAAYNCRKALLDWIFAPLKRRSKAQQDEMRAKRQALWAEHAALRTKYANDPAASQRAMIETYRRDGIDPSSGCVWLMPRLLATYLTDLPTLRRPLRQGFPDWLAGIAVTVQR